MKIYIQSKTGKYNIVYDSSYSLSDSLKRIREQGAYRATSEEYGDMIIPFEEIEYIRKATEDDLRY